MEHDIELDRKAHDARVARQGGPPRATSPLLQIQQLAGNHAVQTWLRNRGIQAKLKIGSPDDPAEHEADAIADRIMRSPAPHPYPATCSCAEGEEQCEACQAKNVSIHRSATGGTAVASAPSTVENVLRSPGRPLDSATRSFFEPRFGRRFDKVRVHTENEAQHSARSIQAHAYTAGEHLIFDAGKYTPETDEGKRLLAHELTHVVQQSGSNELRPGSIQRSPNEDAGKPSAQGDAAQANSQVDPAQFWLAVAAEGTKERAKKMAGEAVARLLREQGPRLKELQNQIAVIEHQIAESEKDHIIVGGRTQAIRDLKAQMDEIIKSYDPSVERSSRALVCPAPFLTLPYATNMAPLEGPHLPPDIDVAEQAAYARNTSYAPDMIPDKGVRFGKYGGADWSNPALRSDAVRSSVGDAFAYDIETNMAQVANDLERLARAGYSEIHIATGTHGDAIGGLDPEYSFLRQDARSIYETMQRNPGLKIIPYNMADPVQQAQFNAMQELAADGKLPGGATLSAHCFSRCRVLDPNEPPAGPYASVEVLQSRGLGGVYAQGGLSFGFGALGVYSGLQDPNRTTGALKVIGGGAQMIGGASYAAGYATDSLGLVRFGSKAGEFGGYLTAALVMWDLFHGAGGKFAPNVPPMKPDEAFSSSVEDSLKVASIFFWEAVPLELGFHYVVEPVAQKGAEYLTPMFMGAMTEIYGSRNMFGTP